MTQGILTLALIVCIHIAFLAFMYMIGAWLAGPLGGVCMLAAWLICICIHGSGRDGRY